MKNFLNRLKWSVLLIAMVAIFVAIVGFVGFIVSGNDFWLYKVFGPFYETSAICIILHIITDTIHKRLN